MLGQPFQEVCLIGAPTDVGTSSQGTQDGPSALRHAGLVDALKALGLHVVDAGDVQGPPNPHDDERIAYRNLEAVTQWCQALHDGVYQALGQGQMPLMVGGDHSLAMGSISAVARFCREQRKPLWVFWIDAHADFNTVDSSPTGNMHGMPLRVLCGQGASALTSLSGVCPALDVAQVRQIGVRSVDPQEQVALEQTHLPVFTMQAIQAEGMEAILTRALQDVPVNAHVHISFDVDSLDPQDAPGVGTPAEGGPTWLDIQMCLQRIAQTGRVGSMDVVELNPWRDVQAQTTLLVKTLLMDCFQAHVRACSQAAIARVHRVDEFAMVNDLVARVQAESLPFDHVQRQASLHVERLRAHAPSTGMNQLMLEYALSSEEGMALMCLAEALLRIPDVPTREALIRDTLSHADWSSHLGHSRSVFVNAATWGLLLAGQLTKLPSDVHLHDATQGVLRKGGVSLVRRALEVAVGMMGSQFVMAPSIEEALKKSKTYQSKGFVFSFDMLGEAALSDAQAQAYFESYRHAILCMGGQAQQAGVQDGHGISVKLSALHPRYTELQRQRVHAELYPRLLALAQLAKQYDMGLNIDAEESERLMLSLSLFERLVFEPSLAEWEGLGLVVQSYQTRALAVVQHVARLAQWGKRRVMVRLVKGAYWDSEIKRCQQQGLSHFPVFTRKSHTDVSYLACAAELLTHADWIYPQFATHNAHTFASVVQLAQMKGVHAFEMQCLYGMGEVLYQEPVARARNTHQPLRCRMYAPVGAHVSLLPYLVRRMLENGANSSFVSQIVDASVPEQELVQNPLKQAQRESLLSTSCRLPSALLGSGRVNSSGVDVYCYIEWQRWQGALQWHSKHSDCLPMVPQALEVERAVSNAVAYLATWQSTSKMQRAHFLLKAADLLERERDAWLYLLAVEAKKTWSNAVAEVREAVDFCRYYARQLLESKGSLHEAGVAVCISPWNFPLAIFMGQVAAALASGYCVIAKPAEQTPLIGQRVVDVLHRAHVPAYALQCVQGDGLVGARLVASLPVRAVLFTGSNATAKHIQHALLEQAKLEHRAPALLIAETGGQNAMVVDSSAHLEQVVQDVLESGFDSAGQRCSALRVLCVQSEVAPALLTLLKAAMQELTLGHPTDASTDVGPLIDAQAHEAVFAHIERMKQAGHVVWQAGRLSGPELPHMVPPTLIEIQHFSQLHHEVFGPVVHVLVYEHAHVDELIHQINHTGFALTFGIHSRIQSEIERLAQHIRAGNVYVNRNMVGAVVGVQPFGGNGLSGTGPKAGGPLYLHHLMQTPNPYFPRELDLPSPTGEQNHYRLWPRGLVWCSAQTQALLLKQLEACRTTGNTPVVQQDRDGRCLEWVRAWDAVFALAVCWVPEVDVSVLDAVLCEHHVDTLLQVHARLADRHPAIVPVISALGGEYPLHMLYREQVVSINTAALGGNAALMSN